jgi:hypothetical protein
MFSQPQGPFLQLPIFHLVEEQLLALELVAVGEGLVLASDRGEIGEDGGGFGGTAN